MKTLPYGFRIVGDCTGERRLVQASAAFLGYASADDRAQVDREGFLSAFQFGDDFRTLLKATGSVRGFDGVCWSPWLWFDIDRDDLGAALHDARRLASCLVERYRLDDDALLAFFSGSKGFHIGLPTSLWSAEPATTFHKAARRFAERVGELCQIQIDTGVYDRVRAFRAPNSLHPKTGLHKRRLTHDELLNLTIDGIKTLATKPEAFDMPSAPPEHPQAKADWDFAITSIRGNTEAIASRSASRNNRPNLNRATLDFIRNGADAGERHTRLFSAAANLAEFGCREDLAHALLTEAALDSGLPPAEVRRQINCGLAHVGTTSSATAVEKVLLPASADTTRSCGTLQSQLAQLWNRETPVKDATSPTVAAAQ